MAISQLDTTFTAIEPCRLHIHAARNIDRQQGSAITRSSLDVAGAIIAPVQTPALSELTTAPLLPNPRGKCTIAELSATLSQQARNAVSVQPLGMGTNAMTVAVVASTRTPTIPRRRSAGARARPSDTQRNAGGSAPPLIGRAPGKRTNSPIEPQSLRDHAWPRHRGAIH